jgi:hypothetical protein
MTLTELAGLLPLIEQFAPEIKSFIQMLQTTPEEQHQELMMKIQNAFNEQKNNGRPGSL